MRLAAPHISEAELQKALFTQVRWRRVPGVIGFAVPNGDRRDLITGARLKGQGVLAGVSDTIWIKQGGIAHFLELKVKGGRLSDAQDVFAEAVGALGCPSAVAWTLDEAIGVLKDWGMIR